MVTLTIATSMGELTSVPLNTDQENVLSMLKETAAVDIELADGSVAFIPAELASQSVFFIRNVPEQSEE